MSYFITIKQTASIAAWLMLFSAQASQANTLTIGKGSGEVWRGAPFTLGLQTQNQNSATTATRGAASITNSMTECLTSSSLVNIASIDAFPIAPGIGLVPTASFNVNTFTNLSLYPVNMAGTLGMNGTAGTLSGSDFPQGGDGVVPPNRAWCINFFNTNTSILLNLSQTMSGSGEWVIVTDGTQQSGTYPMPTMYGATFSDRDQSTKNILPYTFLRVNLVSCSITTPTSVDFGTVARNTLHAAELANMPQPFTVSCGQDNPNTIDTNINVQFSGNVFEGNTARLALNEGGGYITGEISNGVTGSGTCDASTGVNFNSTDINVGVLTASTLSQTFTNQIIWRLCSGGSALPIGPVNASANVAVTYN
ncbi:MULTISPECIES: fimbrial protein [unclassified Symbiopectobacterium]|uniref:fimbrial protein n=1 Tax=unclassified Symbiopectobacterium TaxID=2794573 RepID=UPI002225E9FF|nr:MULTISPECIES: fimbrial protein [unclassified Symbiopectobacterium]MCW2474164.1 type 1 fimbrial protein [Candidatus Symbiopectobacterium sp. NZEC151]MCW2485402.1 type 1 fimbrial protein [Candidatus Symbiopectobacterium sp. NZEC127]